MTLLAAHISADRVRLLADGLSCHENLTIVPRRNVGANEVSAYVPGRTTLQKIFPHPQLPIAIAHCGNNQRNGVPVRTIIEQFWRDTGEVAAEYLPQRFKNEFGSGSEAETSWLVGFGRMGNLILEVVGNDYQRIDEKRLWSGSGRDSLSSRWPDLESLCQQAEQFLADCQRQAPFNLPFFANCFGGHWHHLQIRPDQRPHWLVQPCGREVKVSSLLLSPPLEVRCDSPAQYIQRRGEELKGVLRAKFKRRVRGSLRRVADENLREQIARLIAIFDEVQLDSSVATEPDARRYAGAIEEVIVDLSAH